MTPQKLAYEDDIRDPRLYKAVFLAEQTREDGAARALGVATIGHDALAHRRNKFVMDIRVRPEWQGQNIGACLYQTLVEHLTSFAPCEIQANVWAAHEQAMRFVRDRGFTEAWRRIDSTLDVARFDFAPYNALEASLPAQGVVIKTYEELASDPERMIKLHALDRTLWEDIPYGETVTRRSLEQFTQEEILAPHFLADACFIALHGDNYIGYSNLTKGVDHYLITMTGVLQNYRKKGIATVLKIGDIRYAQKHGTRELRTTNDSVNAAIRTLNTKLGFREEGATVRFVKRLAVTSQK
jgi:GNAT superfamily N-acetyltransferase